MKSSGDRMKKFVLKMHLKGYSKQRVQEKGPEREEKRKGKNSWEMNVLAPKSEYDDPKKKPREQDPDKKFR